MSVFVRALREICSGFRVLKTVYPPSRAGKAKATSSGKELQPGTFQIAGHLHRLPKTPDHENQATWGLEFTRTNMGQSAPQPTSGDCATGWCCASAARERSPLQDRFFGFTLNPKTCRSIESQVVHPPASFVALTCSVYVLQA